MLLSIFGGLSICLPTVAMFGVYLEDKSLTINTKLSSGIFASVLLINNIVFCFLNIFPLTLYIIITGGLLLIWMLVLYGVSRSRQ